MAERIGPGGTVGILGGGQLGRMLAMAAARLGLDTVILDPDAGAPAGRVAARHIRAAYDDAGALAAFAEAVDVATFEFENVPTAALDALEGRVPVRPGRAALATSQDRLEEKRFLAGLGIATAPFAAVDGPADLAEALAETGLPAILKTRRFGYDGKGQHRVTTETDARKAAIALEGRPAILEGLVPFEAEISVIAARDPDGRVAAFDPGRNVHEDGILRTTTLPSGLPAAVEQDAVLSAGKILNALDYVGVIGVEFFWAPGAARPLVANEFAPRVHNSGHWTEAACTIDQFEQHIRAVCGWPLGDGQRHSDAVMTNLLGAEALSAPDTAGDRLHLYGKAEARPGRKMGHRTRISPRAR